MSRISNPVAIAVFDIDGVLRDVSGSYQRALADTVEKFTDGQYRPTDDEIDTLKGEGLWNNDWEASQELVYRYFEQQGKPRDSLALSYEAMVDFFQSRYRGENQADPNQWTGYISQEPLLTDLAYFESLSNGGATHGRNAPGSDSHGRRSRQT
jgi:HAD superfamily phosphatase